MYTCKALVFNLIWPDRNEINQKYFLIYTIQILPINNKNLNYLFYIY